MSHGHNDHSGGLQYFCEHNKTALIYLSAKSFEPHYVLRRGEFQYIGLEPALDKYRDRFVFTQGHLVIDGELQLFSEIPTHDYLTDAGKALRTRVRDDYRFDLFDHEQNLLITSGGKAVLVAGCAHNGIVNIMRQAESILGRAPDYAVGGFHLFDPFSGKTEPKELIEQVGAELGERPTLYYTGHCTGQAAFDQLHNILKKSLSNLGTGSVITI